VVDHLSPPSCPGSPLRLGSRSQRDGAPTRRGGGSGCTTTWTPPARHRPGHTGARPGVATRTAGRRPVARDPGAAADASPTP
jgi:hypothetical protein